MDFNIRLSNDQVLRGVIHSPGEKIKAAIVLIHGLGEHIQRYACWADLFKKEGIGFAGVDLPGHGRSQGRRGSIKNYKLLGEMIDILLSICKKTFPGIPVYLYGHSLGGGVVLHYLLHKSSEFNGAIVTSPWLVLTFKPPRIKFIMASLMKNIIPGLIQSSGINASHISHDEVVVENYIKDPLVHGKISVSLFHSATNAARYSLIHASELKVPVLILHGSDDKITSPKGSREFAQKTQMVELRIWPYGYHELHNEPFKDDVFKFILDWINSSIT